MCVNCVNHHKPRKEFIVRTVESVDMVCKVARQMEEQGAEVLSITSDNGYGKTVYRVFAKCVCAVQVIGAVDRRHVQDRGEL